MTIITMELDVFFNILKYHVQCIRVYGCHDPTTPRPPLGFGLTPLPSHDPKFLGDPEVEPSITPIFPEISIFYVIFAQNDQFSNPREGLVFGSFDMWTLTKNLDRSRKSSTPT